MSKGNTTVSPCDTNKNIETGEPNSLHDDLFIDTKQEKNFITRTEYPKKLEG